MVTQHEAGGARAFPGSHHFDLSTEQRVANAVHAGDAAAVEDDRMLSSQPGPIDVYGPT